MEQRKSAATAERFFYDSDSDESFVRGPSPEASKSRPWTHPFSKEEIPPNLGYRRIVDNSTPLIIRLPDHAATSSKLPRPSQSIPSLTFKIQSIERKLRDNRPMCQPPEAQSTSPETRDLRSKLTMTRVVLNETQQSLLNCRSQLRSFEDRTQNLQREKESLKALLDKKDRSCQSLQKRCSSLESRNEELNKENRRLQSQLAKVNRSAGSTSILSPSVHTVSNAPSLRARAPDSSDSESPAEIPLISAGLKSEVRKLRRENGRMRTELVEVRSLYNELKCRESRSASVFPSRSESESERKSFVDSLPIISSEVESLRSELEGAQRQLSDTCDCLRTKDREMENLTAELSSLRRELTESKEGLSEENRRLQSQLAQMNRSGGSAPTPAPAPAPAPIQTTTFSTLSPSVHTVSNTPSLRARAPDSSDSESPAEIPPISAGLKSEVRKLRRENGRMRTELVEVRSLYNELKCRESRSASVFPSRSESESERKSFVDSLPIISSEVESLRSELEGAQRQLSDTCDCLRTKDREMENLTAELSSLRRELTESKETNEIVKRQLRVVEDANDTLQQELNRSSQPLIDLSTPTSTQCVEFSSRDQELSDLRHTVSDLKRRILEGVSSSAPPLSSPSSPLSSRSAPAARSPSPLPPFPPPINRVSIGVQVSVDSAEVDDQLSQLLADNALLETKVQSFQSRYSDLRHEYSVLQSEHSDNLEHMQESFRELSELKQRNSDLESSLLQLQSQSCTSSEDRETSKVPEGFSPLGDSRFLDQRCTELMELNADLTATNDILQTQIDQLKTRLQQISTAVGPDQNALSLQSFALPDSLMILSATPGKAAPSVGVRDTLVHFYDSLDLPLVRFPRVLSTVFSQWDLIVPNRWPSAFTSYRSSAPDSSHPPLAPRLSGARPSPIETDTAPQCSSDDASDCLRSNPQSLEAVVPPVFPFPSPKVFRSSPSRSGVVPELQSSPNTFSTGPDQRFPFTEEGAAELSNCENEDYLFSSPSRLRGVQTTKLIRRSRRLGSSDADAPSLPLPSNERMPAQSRNLTATPKRSEPILQAVFSKCVSSESPKFRNEGGNREITNTSLLTNSTDSLSGRDSDRERLESELNNTLALLERAIPLEEWVVVERGIQECIDELGSPDLDAVLEEAAWGMSQLDPAVPLDFDDSLFLWETLLLLHDQATSPSSALLSPEAPPSPPSPTHADMNIFRLNESTIRWSSGSSDSEVVPSEIKPSASPLNFAVALGDKDREISELQRHISTLESELRSHCSPVDDICADSSGSPSSSALAVRVLEEFHWHEDLPQGPSQLEEFLLLIHCLLQSSDSHCGQLEEEIDRFQQDSQMFIDNSDELLSILRAELQGKQDEIDSLKARLCSVSHPSHSVPQTLSVLEMAACFEASWPVDDTRSLSAPEQESLDLDSIGEEEGMYDPSNYEESDSADSVSSLVGIEADSNELHRVMEDYQRRVEQLEMTIEDQSAKLLLQSPVSSPSKRHSGVLQEIRSFLESRGVDADLRVTDRLYLEIYSNDLPRSATFLEYLLDSSAQDLLRRSELASSHSPKSLAPFSFSLSLPARRPACLPQGGIAAVSLPSPPASAHFSSSSPQLLDCLHHIESLKRENHELSLSLEILESENKRNLHTQREQSQLLREKVQLSLRMGELEKQVQFYSSLSPAVVSSSPTPSPLSALARTPSLLQAFQLPSIDFVSPQPPAAMDPSLLLLFVEERRLVHEPLHCPVHVAGAAVPLDLSTTAYQPSFSESDSYQLLRKLVKAEKSLSDKSRDRIALLRRSSDLDARLRILEGRLDRTARSHDTFLGLLADRVQSLLRDVSAHSDSGEQFLRAGLDGLLLEIDGFREVQSSNSSGDRSGSPLPSLANDSSASDPLGDSAEALSTSFGFV